MQGRLSSLHKNRAENGVRTRDLRLGKPTLYQLSYFRIIPPLGEKRDYKVTENSDKCKYRNSKIFPTRKGSA